MDEVPSFLAWQTFQEIQLLSGQIIFITLGSIENISGYPSGIVTR